MHIIITLVIGLVTGAVAKFLMPGKDPGGIIVTALLGVAGAFVADYAAPKIGWYPHSTAMHFVAAVAGAMVLLLAYRIIFRRSS